MEIDISTLKKNYCNILFTDYEKFSETKHEIEKIDGIIPEDLKTITVNFLYLLKLGRSLFSDDSDLLSVIRSHFKYEGPFLVKLFRKDEQYKDKVDLRLVLPRKILSEHEKKILSRFCEPLKIPSSEQDDFINNLETGGIKASELFLDKNPIKRMDFEIEQLIEPKQSKKMNLKPTIFFNEFINIIREKADRYLELNQGKRGEKSIEDQINSLVKTMFIRRYYRASISGSDELDDDFKKLIKVLSTSAVSNYITMIINSPQFIMLLVTVHNEIKSDFPWSCNSKSGIGQGINYNVTKQRRFTDGELTPSIKVERQEA